MSVETGYVHPAPPPPGLLDGSALIAAIEEPCLLTTGSDRIVALNARAAALLQSGDDAAGQRLEQVLRRRCPDGGAGLDALFDRAREPGADALLRLRLRTDDGPVAVLWSVRVVPSGAGASYDLHRIYPDRPEHPNQAYVEFLQNVSHELRTPLSALVATTELMLQDYATLPSAELGQMMGLLHRNTRRLESLVGNLLDAAGLQNGRLQLRRSVTSVQSLVRDAADFVLPLLNSKNQKLETRTIGDPPALSVDPKRIVGVLVNLLSNASRYGPPNEPIQLLIAGEGTLVRFTVRQKGPGIPPHEQALLFQRFYRASTGLSQTGTGLGLAIVKELVEMHGGSVGLLSKPGKTTAFWFTLPVEGVAP